MRANQVGLCYYPTTAVLVDDQLPFLNKLQLGLHENRPYKFYSNSNELIAYFAQYQSEHFIKNCVSFDEDGASRDMLVHQVSLRNIRNVIYNPRRYEQISVLIADYAMPGANGLECCAAVKDKYIKKALLTGEAENDLGIKAFNERRIDKFIQKSIPNLFEVLNTAISELQLKYFLDLSDSLRGAIDNHDLLLAVLDDPVFTQFFYDICESKQIAEYYILDRSG